MGRMKMKTFASRLRDWLSNLPIQDPVERRMAALVQVILFGFIVIVLIAALLNLVIAPGLPWQAVLIPSSIFILIIGFPLALLRRGHFRSSVLVIIAIFFILETIAVTTASLREIAETLPFFTLTIVLAGLLLGRRALALTFTFSAGVILLTAFREQNAEVRTDSIIIASNFILLNGLMSLFLDQFGLTLRRALTAALAREGELQNEIDIRRQAEEALAASELRYRMLFESNPRAMWVYDLETLRFLAVNGAAVEHYGYSRDEFLSMTIKEIRPAEDVSTLMANLMGSQQDLHTPTVWRHYKKDGTLIDVEITSHSLQWEERPARLVLANDITARKQAEAGLQDTRMQLEGIFNTTMDAIITVDGGQKIVIFNPAAEQMFGCPASEVIGQTLDRFLPEYVRQDHREHLRVFGQSNSTKRSMKTPSLALTCLRADGEAFPSEVSISQLELGGRKLFTATVRDVTERKRAEDALRSAEQNYRNIFENATEGIHQSTHDGKIINVNPSAARMFGFDSPEEMMASVNDLNTRFYVEPGRRAEFKRLMETHGAASDFESEMYRKDGSTIWISENAHTVRDEHGTLLYYEGTSVDITGRKQAEEEIKKQLDELQRWHNATLGRESRILDLKREVNELLSQTGKPPRYPSAE
jgi:PAS domain S-box-containing protein